MEISYVEMLRRFKKDAVMLRKKWEEKLEGAESILKSAEESRNLAFNELCVLEERRDQQYEAMKAADKLLQEIWDEYENYRDYKNSHIELLRLKYETERALMRQCFEWVDFAYKNRDKAEANRMRSAAYGHSRRSSEISDEISSLQQQICAAKDKAVSEASKINSEEYLKLEKSCEEAKFRYEATIKTCEEFEREREICQKLVELAHTTCKKINETLEKLDK